mgnify:FL=1
MAKLPDHVKAIADKHNIPGNAFWDCHGTWVCKHHALEAAAARAGVKWQAPQILEGESAKAVAVLATGSIGDYSEWSIGEASPKNNKNAYPWAMAEKRAKDRVILKLLGFAGEVYSEEEADNFKDTKPANDGKPRGEVSPIDSDGKSNRDLKAEYNRLKGPLDQCGTIEDLRDWYGIFADALNELPEDYRNSLRGEYARKQDALKAKAA